MGFRDATGDGIHAPLQPIVRKCHGAARLAPGRSAYCVAAFFGGALMSANVAPLPAPLTMLLPPMPSDGGGDDLSNHTDGFANTLANAQKSLETDDGDNPDDGSSLDDSSSMGGDILGKLSSLSSKRDEEMSSIMTPFNRADAPILSADGTEDDSNVIGASELVGESLSRASSKKVLKDIINAGSGSAQQTLLDQMQTTLVSNVAQSVSKLVSQQ
jgi:hypothetical protein